MDAWTAERLTANEYRFRAVNERLEDDVRRVADDGEAIEFVCECSVVACHETVALALDQYRELQSVDDRSAVVPGHEMLEIERIVGRADGHLVVQKLAD